MKKYRLLTKEEIDVLIHQGCKSDNWLNIEVVENFNALKVRTTSFSGHNKLGYFEKEFLLFGGIKKYSGISDATLHNCTVGDNVYIAQIKNYIANYVIEDGAYIEDVDILAVEGPTSFGNGVKVSALNEAGGREVPIFDRLSAHLGYILALYRHRPLVIEKITAMIQKYTASVTSNFGVIGRNSKLINCRTILNVKIGEFSTIDSIYRLFNGTINSCESDPVYFGSGVIAENFISSTGSRVTDGVMISHCFIGQGTHLGKQYSAENSLFFANCAGFHGEACSVFAGPYTVTHHKSTLLIAGYFLFSNAGSGSNQSNHMYKLGPIHQGIVERGSKTTSDSYLLWPAKVGAFSLVMGRHYKNSDTSDLPFSYLIESNDESILVPGVNLRSVGTVRDALKWPKRDVRKDQDKLDLIHFKLLSPYTVQKMIKGVGILKTLKKTSGETSNFYSYQSAKIKNSSLNHGLYLYQLAINKYLGNTLISRMDKMNYENNRDIQNRLKPDTPFGAGEWLDMAGLFVPKTIGDNLLADIENDKITGIQEINEVFASIFANYRSYEWTWTIDVISRWWGKNYEDITSRDIIEMVELWKKSVVDLDNLLYADAKKEFTLIAKTGFGVDGNEQDKELDFEMVRGEFEQNSFAKTIQEHITRKSVLGNKVIEEMKKIV